MRRESRREEEEEEYRVAGALQAASISLKIGRLDDLQSSIKARSDRGVSSTPRSLSLSLSVSGARFIRWIRDPTWIHRGPTNVSTLGKIDDRTLFYRARTRHRKRSVGKSDCSSETKNMIIAACRSFVVGRRLRAGGARWSVVAHGGRSWCPAHGRWLTVVDGAPPTIGLPWSAIVTVQRWFQPFHDPLACEAGTRHFQIPTV